MSAVSKKKSDKKDKIILNIQRTLCYIVLIIISILCLFSFNVLLINDESVVGLSVSGLIGNV